MNTDKESGITRGLGWLALVTSASTLLCCALPILLVTLGMGATVAALSSSLPFLVSLGEQKIWLFGISGMLLLISGWLQYRTSRSCPVDPELAAACERTQRWNRRIFRSALLLWGVGFFAAYFALPIRIWLDF
jgi:hypothetical protein